MTEAEMGFRTAPLGFKREDVLAFIETETARRAQAAPTSATGSGSTPRRAATRARLPRISSPRHTINIRPSYL